MVLSCQFYGLLADLLYKDYNFDHKFSLSIPSSTGLVILTPLFNYYH